MICANCKNEVELKDAYQFVDELWCDTCTGVMHHNPTEAEQYHKYVADYRTKIPDRYNQIALASEIFNPSVDHLISISNRTDGKTFNYIGFALELAVDYGIGLCFLSRNMMLRLSYQTLIEEIIEESSRFERNDFSFVRNQYYIALNHNNKTIAIISDLNNATELKYFSSFIRKFPLMIYDEFLALETDYLTDEWDRLKTIYESIDRVADRPYIKKPKILYLGNAVNFESPILHGLKLFNILEKHPINSARIYNYGYNVMLEMNKNESANTQRNTGAFDSLDDSMTTGQFETNDHNIATDDDRWQIRKNPRTIYVKLRNDYLKIWFNRTTLDVILSIEKRIDEPYQFNLQLKDNRPDSLYLKETYFDDTHIKKIDKGAYLFDNNFSKNTIAGDDYHLNTLKIHKLIKISLHGDDETVESESKEKQFHVNYIEQTKKGLMTKFWE